MDAPQGTFSYASAIHLGWLLIQIIHDLQGFAQPTWRPIQLPAELGEL